MSFLSMAAQGGSIITGIMGSLMEGEAAATNAELRARADDFNATVADQLAKAETSKAGADAMDFRRAQKSKMASSRARQAASGFAFEGSPMMVDEATFAEIEFGAQRIVHGGQVASTRLRNEGSLLRASAAGERISAGNIRKASKINAFGTALKGVASIGINHAGSSGSPAAGRRTLTGSGSMWHGISAPGGWW